MATSAVAAMAARARREIQHRFFAADAVRPDRAIGFDPANRMEQRQFERLRQAGAVHEVSPGRYWLDLPAYDQLLQERFGRVRLVLLALFILLVLLAGYGSAGGFR